MGTVPKTRLDKVVKVREKQEEGALGNLANARASLNRARERLAGAVSKAQSDGRQRSPIDYWELEDAAHARALQAVKAAKEQVVTAETAEAVARAGYTTAHQQAQVVRRAADRKKAEIVSSKEKAEQKDLDELATQRFNTER